MKVGYKYYYYSGVSIDLYLPLTKSLVNKNKYILL